MELLLSSEPQDCEGDVENDRREQHCPEESIFPYSSDDAKIAQVSGVDFRISRVHFSRSPKKPPELVSDERRS